jgi:DNA-3-methyladenine glycosylase I
MGHKARIDRAGLTVDEQGVARCFWAGTAADYAAYHDEEWGYPVADDHRLFEKLCLEGFQSGLSWLTILRKRAAFRRVFAGFDFHRVARFGPEKVESLLQDARIVRHRGKIEAAIHNARQAIALAAEYGSLAAYFWSHEPAPDTRPARLTRELLVKMTTSPASVALSKDLKRRGFRFVGPTTMYAFMQAMGLVNDHVDGCHVQREVATRRASFTRPIAART